jgi:two-component system, sensor histidine kinase and response regulator
MTILLVSNHSKMVAEISQLLKRYRFVVQNTNSAQDAFELAQNTAPELILLDVHLHVGDGYDLCQTLKSQVQTRDLSVMFVSEVGEVDAKVRAFQAGALDYVTYPFHNAELLLRIQAQINVQQRFKSFANIKQREIEQMVQVTKSKDETLRMVAHDLKNPLHVINVSLDLVDDFVRDHQGNADTVELLGLLRQSSARMVTIVRDVLDAAVMEGKLEFNRVMTAVIPYLQTYLEEFQQQAKTKNIRFQLSLPPEKDWPSLAIEQTTFGHIFYNLFSNALKYTGAGGQITFRVEVQPLTVHFYVEDSGIGIPADALPNLFEKFYRVQDPQHRDRTGRGLGLSIVKAIVQRHNGEIDVKSKVGEGTTFVVTMQR